MAKSLREYLETTCEQSIAKAQKTITESKEALEILSDVDLNNSRYVVNFISLSGSGLMEWDLHKKSLLAYSHMGKLKDAIRNAEEEFKSITRCSEIDRLTHYFVEIYLGEKKYGIPEIFYEKFKERKRIRK